jgi:hypothetical protein
VGNDRNESPRKPRTRPPNAPAQHSPFARKSVDADLGTLEDVPGILGTLEAATTNGRAIMLSHTSDGGAWCITVLDGGQRYKAYATGQSELDEVFDDLARAYQGNE